MHRLTIAGSSLTLTSAWMAKLVARTRTTSLTTAGVVPRRRPPSCRTSRMTKRWTLARQARWMKASTPTKPAHHHQDLQLQTLVEATRHQWQMTAVPVLITAAMMLRSPATPHGLTHGRQQIAPKQARLTTTVRALRKTTMKRTASLVLALAPTRLPSVEGTTPRTTHTSMCPLRYANCSGTLGATSHTTLSWTRRKCFIPDYIPAVGEIDAFIKVSRPDGKPDDLGLKVLDEPSAQQSDPTVLDLIWRSLIKMSNLDPVRVVSIEHADKKPKEITKWINSINDLHRTKPPPQVQYTKSMPDIEMLMQEWPPEFEQRLKQVKLPSADINLTLKEYAAVICAMMDIPVYNSTIQSLHVLFTLYSEFKTNQHFMNIQAANTAPPSAAGAGAGAGSGGAGTNTMTF